jgi:hypothetical protein
LLAQFADERERWLALTSEQGITHTTRHGAIRVHPGVGEARRLEVRRMSSLADLMQRRRDALGR